MQETVDRLSSGDANGGKGYEHLVIYAHGGLNSLVDEAKRIATWQRNDIFGRNKLYNFHLMWGSGFLDEAFGELSESPAGRAPAVSPTGCSSRCGKRTGSYAWRNMKRDAEAAFGGHDEYDGGFSGLLPLLGASTRRLGDRSCICRPQRRRNRAWTSPVGTPPIQGHQAGTERIHLMAPACSVDFFKQHYGRYLTGTGAMTLNDKIYLYNLTDEIELADTVSSDVPLLPFYSHSRRSPLRLAPTSKLSQTPLAGMQLYEMPKHPKLNIDYSKPTGGATASTTHGGFDNDPCDLHNHHVAYSRFKGSKSADQGGAERLLDRC